jgi:diadenosine tetraphosphatase ApaH/serine/threonine PP2A family protein phosphatase
MRALIVSDIHGNLHALQAVLEAASGSFVGGYDQLWNLGDMVGYGARPNEVLDLLRPLATINVRGNHDRVCSGLTDSHSFNPIAAEAAAWTHHHLTIANLEWLRSVPQGPIRATDRILCAHGSPLHEDHYIESMRDAWIPLQLMESEITFFGHTHIQGGFSRHDEEWEEIRPTYSVLRGLWRTRAERYVVDVTAGTRHLINPGSVGQPRDFDWRAAFAVYDDSTEQVTFFRVPYDVKAAQAAIRAAHLPERLASRLATGR